jgi:hypothetical protein
MIELGRFMMIIWFRQHGKEGGGVEKAKGTICLSNNEPIFLIPLLPKLLIARPQPVALSLTAHPSSSTPSCRITVVETNMHTRRYARRRLPWHMFSIDLQPLR